jgi:hypothetical protein
MSDNQRTGSLVLGGYDNSRISGKPVSFKLSPDSAQSKDLLVSVASIDFRYNDHTGKGVYSPLQSSFNAILDSTLPYLFLPTDVCETLKDALGLEYDQYSDLYTINSTSLASNKDNINSITISLSAAFTGSTNDTIGIIFPYNAFDAVASWTWGYNGSQSIFPIRRAPSNTAVLGRAFFQEAYVSYNSDEQTFNVSQAKPLKELNPNAQIMDLTPPSTTSHNASGLPSGAIIGIAIGTTAVALVIISALLWFCLFKPRREKKRKVLEEDEARRVKEAETLATSETTNPYARPQRYRGNTMMSEASGETAVSELPARRPSHGRNYSNVSELSSDSEVAGGLRRSTMGRLGYIHEDEMAYKSDAAELEGWVARNQREHHELEGRDELLTLPLPSPSNPSELEANARGASPAPTSTSGPGAPPTPGALPESAASPGLASSANPMTPEMHWTAPFARRDRNRDKNGDRDRDRDPLA